MEYNISGEAGKYQLHKDTQRWYKYWAELGDSVFSSKILKSIPNSQLIKYKKPIKLITKVF